MKLLKAMVCVSAVAFVAGCAAGPEMARGGSVAGAQQSLIAANWVKVDENHAEMQRDGKRFLLDSYIVMFQQPYYVHVRTAAGDKLRVDDVEALVKEYIQPRGCTSPMVRDKKLDKQNADSTELVLGVLC